MRRDAPPADFVDPDERLYRHCHPEHVSDSPSGPVVHEAAVKQFNLSVLRSGFAEPDDARWESAVANTGKRPAQVYAEFFVIEIPVGSATMNEPPPSPEASSHSCRPAHVPYPDNYAHSEIHTYRDSPEKRYVKEGDLGVAGKLAKRVFRIKLAAASRVLLRPFEGSIYSEADLPG